MDEAVRKEASKQNPALSSNHGETTSSITGAGISPKFLFPVINGAVRACTNMKQKTPDDVVGLALCNFLVTELTRIWRASIKQLEIDYLKLRGLSL